MEHKVVISIITLHTLKHNLFLTKNQVFTERILFYKNHKNLLDLSDHACTLAYQIILGVISFIHTPTAQLNLSQ
ncbi:hypothetical protein COTS27_01616 [Spirochaetota bacterium]|nr:hypothetical protein COTS27_01616 [Spirochaetota bacterium]